MIYNTEKREEIINFLKENCGKAYSAEQICSAILKDGRGKSTVFRIISKLLDEGIIQRISDAKTRRVTYQYIHTGHCREHLHLKCKECGRLIHLSEEVSHVFGQKILSAEGFEIDVGALLYGKCDTCVHKEGAV